ncbi:MAG TPA: hypothetical protein VJ724_12935 [Tahibacter sp.]|nr:hypothetical protein [Tahibacter sp.]
MNHNRAMARLRFVRVETSALFFNDLAASFAVAAQDASHSPHFHDFPGRRVKQLKVNDFQASTHKQSTAYQQPLVSP